MCQYSSPLTSTVPTGRISQECGSVCVLFWEREKKKSFYIQTAGHLHTWAGLKSTSDWPLASEQRVVKAWESERAHFKWQHGLWLLHKVERKPTETGRTLTFVSCLRFRRCLATLKSSVTSQTHIMISPDTRKDDRSSRSIFFIFFFWDLCIGHIANEEIKPTS